MSTHTASLIFWRARCERLALLTGGFARTHTKFMFYQSGARCFLRKPPFTGINFHLSYHFRECGFCRQQRSQVGRYNALQGRDVLKGAAHQQRDAAGSLLYFFVPYSQKPRSFCSACRTRASTYSDRWRVTKFIRTQVIYYKKKTLLIIPCAFHLKNKLSAKRIKQWQCIFFLPRMQTKLSSPRLKCCNFSLHSPELCCLRSVTARLNKRLPLEKSLSILHNTSTELE